MALIKFELYFDDELNEFVAVDPITGETKHLTEKKKSTKKTSSKKEDDNPNPEITLLENKYVLNNAAIELLGVEPDDKLHIQIVHGDPIIGKCEVFGLEKGNRFCKNGGVSYRGKNREALAVFGEKFTLIATDKDGQFLMKGDAPELPKETEEIANIDDINDLEDLIDSTDETPNFTFNL